MNDDDATDLLDRLGHGLPDSTPPTSLLAVGRRRRRRRTRVRVGGVVAAAAVIGGVALAVPSLPVWDEPGPSLPNSSELAEAGGRPCPDVLPHKPGSDGEGFGTQTPASSVPNLPPARRGWVCNYGADTVPGGDHNGDYVTWRLRGQALSLNDSQLATAVDALSGLSLPDGQGCDDNLGPRWLLVTENNGDLTGIAVDAFGCETVRLTDSPAVNEPGIATQPGTGSGAFEGLPDLADFLREAVTASAEQSR